MAIAKNIFIICCFFLFSISVTPVLAQPANDECLNAIEITPQPAGSACSAQVSANTTNGTASANTPTCGNNVADDDIWYKFIASATSVVVRFSNATHIPSGTTSPGLAIYQGACPASTGSFFCTSGFGFGTGHTIVNGLTPGETYFLRFWSPSATNPIQFNFCVENLVAPPSNDDCGGALALTVQPFGQSCTSSILVNTAGATQSTVPASSCGNAENNDDVWLQFNATSGQQIFRYGNLTQLLGSPNNLGMTLYDGGPSASATCPATTTNVFCTAGFGFFNGYQLVGGFIPGHTYFIRIWASGTQNFASFDFCVQEVPPPPANDDCTNATSLTVQPFGQSCTSSILVNTAGATSSTVPASSCGNAENNDDVWLKFNATSGQHVFRFGNLTQLLGSPNNLGMTLYDGGPSASATCPATTANVFCSAGFGFFNGYQLVGGFIPGHTYFIRIWAGGTQNFASFDFCVQEVPPPPANDDCTNATSLTVQPFGQSCTSSILVNTAGATQSTVPASSCGNAENNDDVWLKFNATSGQQIFRFGNLTQLLGSPNNLGMTLYDGGPSASATCPATTTNVFCTAGFGFFNGYQLVGGFIPGHTYFIRIWAGGTQNFASFDFCVQEVPPPPANDDCTNATSLTVQPFGQSCTSSILVNTAGATQSTVPASSCGNAENNDDVWLKFNATSGQHIFRYGNLTQLLGSPNSLGMTLYDGGPSASATCPATTANVFCSAGFGFFNGYQLVGGFIPGHTYFIRIWASGTQNFASFDFCVQEVPPPPVNDECTNATEIFPENSSLACSSPFTINTAGATQSANKPSCQQGNTTEEDVWYKFVATSAKIRLIYSDLQQLLGLPTSIGYAFYKSACPTGSAALTCAINFGFFNGKTILEGFEPGETYYLRTWASGNDNFAGYTMCLQAVIPPPNDECAMAIPLVAGAGFCTNAVVTNLFDATTSTGFGSAFCRAGSRSEDVWYTANIPATGNLVVQTSPANETVNDLVMVAYTGNCGALTLLTCDDNGNPEQAPAANHPRMVFSGRTPGEKITFRVVSANESSMGRFSICAWDTSMAVLPPIAPTGTCLPADTLVVSDSLANGYRWLPVFDDSGRIIAEYYPNKSSKDTIFTRLYINGSGTVRQQEGKFYADRTIHFSNTSLPLNGDLRFYVKSSEIAALKGADSTVAGISNLVLRSDTGTCNTAISSRVYAYAANRANYGTDFFLAGRAIKAGQFFMEGACGNTLTWTGAKNNDWHDAANWNCGGVPWISSNVLIPSGAPNMPVVSRPVEIKSLKLLPGAGITVLPGIPVKLNNPPGNN